MKKRDFLGLGLGLMGVVPSAFSASCYTNLAKRVGAVELSPTNKGIEAGQLTIKETETLVLDPKTGYVPLRQGKRVQVIDFFFFDCPHCADFYPLMAAWEKENEKTKEVDFVKIPVAFNANPSLLNGLGLYYGLKETGNWTPELHQKIFDQIHKSKVKFATDDAVSAFLNKELGIRAANVLTTMKAPLMKNRLNFSTAAMNRYQLAGTPTLVIEGAYAISSVESKGVENLVKMGKKAVEAVKVCK